ncbi:hypothetical protein OIPHN330_10770 [Citrobacter freundii]|nr:hypothetical protein OIPHN330_10770 [Citrobacter freundii]BEJ38363.1 hypothetical protein OIPHN354_10750 [Citrobacter freundii]GCB42474.1 hypothetical protein CITFRE_46090 [Citrobacter freundii]
MNNNKLLFYQFIKSLLITWQCPTGDVRDLSQDSGQTGLQNWLKLSEEFRK